MKIEFLRTAGHSYMIVREADYEFENYELQMILHNEIACLLPMQILMGDGRVEYWYEVTGMQSLNRRFEVEQVDQELLKALLRGLCEMKGQMEGYMLDDGNIDFSPDMVFLDRNTNQVRFCYIPGYGQLQNANIQTLLEDTLQHLNHTDSEAVRIGYEVYENCVRSDFLVSECLRVINREPVLPGQDAVSAERDGQPCDYDDAEEPLNHLWDDGEDLTGVTKKNKSGGRGGIALGRKLLHRKKKSRSGSSKKEDRRRKEVGAANGWFESNREAAEQSCVAEVQRYGESRETVRKRDGYGLEGEPVGKRGSYGLEGKSVGNQVGYGLEGESVENQDSYGSKAESVGNQGSCGANEESIGIRSCYSENGRYLSAEGETECFSNVQLHRVWELSYRGDGLEQNLRIEDVPFWLGKDVKRVQGVLQAQTVSRVHACISGTTEELYLEDYNSTNGTYLNGSMIPMNTPMPLHRGDHIVFATEEYVLIDRLVPTC